MRVVVELKRDAVAEVVLNQLYRYSQLQSTFGINAVALTGGRPEVMTLHDLISAFIAFREEVVTRRTKFLLTARRATGPMCWSAWRSRWPISRGHPPHPRRARPGHGARRAHGPRLAGPRHDGAHRLIADPRHRLAEDGTYRLSEEQARAILDLRLQRLTALGRDEIGSELEKLGGEIEDYLSILRSRARVQTIIKDELTQIKTDFATPRRTEIVEQEGEFEAEDLIQREDMVVTVTHAGYIKRVPLATYRAQRRGGKGRAGMAMREADFVSKLFVANTHAPILFFSSRGMAYKMKVWKLPLSAPQARGKALVNLLPLAEGERITTIMPLPEDESQWEALDVMFATTRGTVRRNKLSDFVSVRQNGKIAMKLDEGEGIVGVETCSDDEDVLLSTAHGQCIRFRVTDVRVFKGRDSMGVRGITLGEGDTVISLSILRHLQADSTERQAYLRMRRAMAGEEAEPNGEAGEENGGNGEAALSQERYIEMSAAEQFVLSISANGYGKRTSSFEYRVTGRGGKGIVAMTVNERNGPLVASFPVEHTDQIMLVTDRGQLIRTPVDDIRIAGRSTQGVTLFDVAEGETVVSVGHLSEEEAAAGEENGEGNGEGNGFRQRRDIVWSSRGKLPPPLVPAKAGTQ
jgi:DNA gyrase subunit A